MKFSYGLEVEGMALGEDYEMIKNFLRNSDENYFITGDESIQISDDLIDQTYTLEGEMQEIVPFEIHLGPFTFPNEDHLHTARWMLRQMAYYGALTNDSCAFHMHIKPQKYELHSPLSISKDYSMYNPTKDYLSHNGEILMIRSKETQNIELINPKFSDFFD